MITVRFPSGFSIQYNSATTVKPWGDMLQLIKGSGETGTLIAMVPKECVIEWHAPCRTYNPISTDSDDVKSQLESLAKSVRSLTRKVNK